jgi:hypothetical protein
MLPLHLFLNSLLKPKHQKTSIIVAQRLAVSKTMLADLHCNNPRTSLTDSKLYDLGRASGGHGDHLNAFMCLRG